MRAHHRPRAEELLAAHLIERRRRVLQHVELVEHDLRARQHRADHVHIWPVHIGADGVHGGPLPRVQPAVQQAPQTVFAAVLCQPDDVTAHHVGQDRPVPLALASMDFVDTEMPRAPLPARAIPRIQERALGAA